MTIDDRLTALDALWPVWAKQGREMADEQRLADLNQKEPGLDMRLSELAIEVDDAGNRIDACVLSQIYLSVDRLRLDPNDPPTRVGGPLRGRRRPRRLPGRVSWISGAWFGR